MRASCLMLIVALSVAPTPQCQAWLLDLLKPVAADKLGGLWDAGEMELLDHYCSYTIKPTVKSFELYFIGSVWCPGWTPLRGEAETRSRSGVLGKASRDFVRKALAAGLISDDEARNWNVR